MKKVLFVCMEARLRSRTAADHFAGKYDTRRAGIGADALVAVTQELVDWADVIVCMEIKQRKKVLKKYDLGDTPIIAACIPDDYNYMDGMLIALLEQAEERWA